MIVYLKELWSYRELIYSLVVRDLKVRYKNSVLGIVWSWLNPLLMMLIFTFVFGVLWKNVNMPHYHIFYLSAVLPWNFFSGSVMGGLFSIINNGHLVKKVYFPREVLPISIVISNMVNFIIALPVFFCLAWISGHRLTMWTLLLPLPILIQVTFTLGIVFILSTLEVYYRDTHMLMDVIMQGWFFLTPVIYSVDILTDHATLFGITFNPRIWLFRLNPMASIINTYQDILYRGHATALDFLARTSVTAFLVLIGGYWIFRRFSDQFGETL
ncbi:MAG: ABC transporter permease [Anaerolineae bacterium]|nr:ABC transporter permease [Anaerolineae bacterium]